MNNSSYSVSLSFFLLQCDSESDIDDKVRALFLLPLPVFIQPSHEVAPSCG